MKKIILYLIALMLSSASVVSAQASMKYSPAISSSMKKLWLENFLKNNTEGIKMICDCVPGNEYEDPYSFLVLSKGGNGMILYNRNDSSFIVPKHTIPLFTTSDEYKSFYLPILYGSDASLDAMKNSLKIKMIFPLDQESFYLLRREL